MGDGDKSDLRRLKHKMPRHFVARFPGGGAFGGLSTIFAGAIEKESGYMLRDLFTGGFVASSAGSFSAVIASLPHPKDASKPLYSMKQFEDIYYARLPKYLAYEADHYINHVVHHIARRKQKGDIHIPSSGIDGWLVRRFTEALTKGNVNDAVKEKLIGILNDDIHHEDVPLHVDRTYMEEDLAHLLDGYYLQDTTRSLCITAQKISPGRIGSFDFYNLEPDILRDGCPIPLKYPRTPIPIYKIILATTAFPTVYEGYHIPEIGRSFNDMGLVDTGVDNTIMLRQNLRDGYDVGFVHIGNTNSSHPIALDHYNKMDMIDMVSDSNRYLISASGHQAQDRARRFLSATIGKENMYFLEIDTATPPLPITFNLDILDTNEEQIQRTRAYGHEFVLLPSVRNTMILPVVERLVENKALLEQVRDTTAVFERTVTAANDDCVPPVEVESETPPDEDSTLEEVEETPIESTSAAAPGDEEERKFRVLGYEITLRKDKPLEP